MRCSVQTFGPNYIDYGISDEPRNFILWVSIFRLAFVTEINIFPSYSNIFRKAPSELKTQPEQSKLIIFFLPLHKINKKFFLHLFIYILFLFFGYRYFEEPKKKFFFPSLSLSLSFFPMQETAEGKTKGGRSGKDFLHDNLVYFIIFGKISLYIPFSIE